MSLSIVLLVPGLILANQFISVLTQDYDSFSLPAFVSTGGKLKVKAGDNVKLDCEIKDLGQYTSVWKFNKTDTLYSGAIRETQNERISRDDNTNSLLIKDFKAEDIGEYMCQISTQTPMELIYKVSLATSAPAASAPVIKAQPKDGLIVVKKNDTIRMECDSNEDRVQWRRTDSGLVLKTNSSDDEKLIVRRAHKSDAGTYECIAANAVGRTTFQFNVSVIYAPEVDVQLGVVQASIGQSVELRCVVEADPEPTVLWLGPNSKILRNERTYSLVSSLNISNVTHNQFGNYLCFANNTLGSAQKVIHLVNGQKHLGHTSSTGSRPEITTGFSARYIEATIKQSMYCPTEPMDMTLGVRREGSVRCNGFVVSYIISWAIIVIKVMPALTIVGLMMTRLFID